MRQKIWNKIKELEASGNLWYNKDDKRKRLSGNYIFDANGSSIGFKYRGADYASGTWDTYAYEKNLQGRRVKTIEYCFYEVETAQSKERAEP